jgi:F0F1-type ATP synthase assembly protein I
VFPRIRTARGERWPTFYALMDLEHRRELSRGYGNTLNRSFEFVVVALLFMGAGWLVDRWLGTDPVFLIIFVLVGFIGQGARFWFRYDAEMKVHEAELLAKRAATPKTAASRREVHS